MRDVLEKCALFQGMEAGEIKKCLEWGQAEITEYPKDAFIFRQDDVPEKFLILMEGDVVIARDTPSGSRRIVTTLNLPGEMFGEVFLFLDKKKYENYALAAQRSKVLSIPADILKASSLPNGGKGKKGAEYARIREKLVFNMMSAFAEKAYRLNRNLQILSGSTLRQRIVRLLLQNAGPQGLVDLRMNREDMADFLNTSRPHLSRELMKMREEGLIRIESRKIYVLDQLGMQELC